MTCAQLGPDNALYGRFDIGQTLVQHKYSRTSCVRVCMHVSDSLRFDSHICSLWLNLTLLHLEDEALDVASPSLAIKGYRRRVAGIRLYAKLLVRAGSSTISCKEQLEK